MDLCNRHRTDPATPCGRRSERLLAALRSTAGGGGRARATVLDGLSAECHMLTSSLLLVADGAADCLELAAQRDDVVNWPVLTIVVRPVLEIARSLGVRPPARSRTRRSSSQRCELCGLATTIGQDPTRISTPARRTVGRSARNIVYPRRIPHPKDPQRSETAMQTRKVPCKGCRSHAHLPIGRSQ